MNKVILIFLVMNCVSCVVLPEKSRTNKYNCGLSTDMKVLKFVNLNKRGKQFYPWTDEIFAVFTVPISTVISGGYVLINNTYHLGEKMVKCK